MISRFTRAFFYKNPIIFFLLFFITNNVAALKSNLHVQPTIDAVELYRQCDYYFPDELQFKFDDKFVVKLAETNKKMDAVSFERGMNWHFYDSEYNYEDNKPGHIGRTWYWGRKSLHKLYLKQTEKLNKSLKIKGSFESSLKKSIPILHFVQDMGVPSHVAPIYHVSWKPDNFDGYGNKGKYAYIPKISRNECAQLISDIQSPKDILENLAMSTIKAIKRPIPDSKVGANKTWEIFWNIYPETYNNSGRVKKGFSSYGVCGNNFGAGYFDYQYEKIERKSVYTKCEEDTFEDEYCEEVEAPDYCDLTVDIYDQFYLERYSEIVKASLRMLLYINKNQH